MQDIDQKNLFKFVIDSVATLAHQQSETLSLLSQGLNGLSEDDRARLSEYIEQASKIRSALESFLIYTI